MKYAAKINFLLSFLFLSFIATLSAQDNAQPDTLTSFKIVSAGPQYKCSAWHQFFWGKNYRKEWSTPVKLPVFLLDKQKGGLTPVKEGGGHQTTTLHLETKEGQDYSIRSVDKRLGKVLPHDFLGTFVEHLVNDEVSMSYPYGAPAVADMEQSIGVYHTWPGYVFVPGQPALDTFNKKYAGHVYLFEQRLKGDWKNADNLGNFDKFLDTEEMMKKLFDETENRVDQASYLKVRLFDMFIGDWDRHEGQWAWGIKEDGDKKLFIPVPQDRDQAYFKHNGVALDLAIGASGLNYFQSFKSKVGNINKFNFEERGTDRLFTNELNLENWLTIAKQLQASLTDEVIERSIKKLPPEIYTISGEKIISTLKSRRSQIVDYATKYYHFLAKEVEVVGTEGSEYFEVTPLDNEETSVKLFNKTKKGKKESEPFYSRTFLKSETKEIRLFGLGGKDIYTISGEGNNGIKVRIIGGTDPDSIITISAPSTRSFVYDDKDNYFQTASKTRLHLKKDTSMHYVFKSFVYDKRGIKPTFFYSDEDRFYVGLGYGWEHHKWRKFPFAFKQYAGVNYSISQKAFSVAYKGLFPEAIGKFNLSLLVNYDA
ncbi:MAG: hypothetical protein M3Z56_03440, partial [Bacteroidota bacterium]|nr:hypothetical protein [Bacteroidota bacterium]